MKHFVVLTIALCLLLANSTLAQDVAIFYDASVEVLGVSNAPQFADLLVNELEKKKITAEIVDSDGLAEYMRANQKGIYLITQGQTPGTIFKKEGKKDLVYSWLREGGIGGFVGDYAFYYYWDKGARVEAAAAGQQSVFGVTVTNGTVTNVTPTELGKKYMPSLKKWTSNRASGLNVLQANNFEFESYADDGTNADPIAYRTKDGKEVAKTAADGELQHNNLSVTIGSRKDSGQSFKGVIDDVRLYNRALSPEEIGCIMDGGETAIAHLNLLTTTWSSVKLGR